MVGSKVAGLGAQQRCAHLLAEEGATAALDEVEVGVNLIRAIDGHVEVGDGIEGGEGDAEGCRATGATGWSGS